MIMTASTVPTVYYLWFQRVSSEVASVRVVIDWGGWYLPCFCYYSEVVPTNTIPTKLSNRTFRTLQIRNANDITHGSVGTVTDDSVSLVSQWESHELFWCAAYWRRWSSSASSWANSWCGATWADMSVSVRSVLVEGPQPKAKGPYTYASTPRGLYNNAKLKKDPSWWVANFRMVILNKTLYYHLVKCGPSTYSYACTDNLPTYSLCSSIDRLEITKRLEPFDSQLNQFHTKVLTDNLNHK